MPDISFATQLDKEQEAEAAAKDMEAVDDVSGEVLDTKLVMEARRTEIAFFRKMGVYTKVPRAQAGDAKIIPTKWIDTGKGDANKNKLTHTHEGQKPENPVSRSYVWLYV